MEATLHQSERLAVLETSVKSAHRRLDDQQRMLENMREMSLSIKEILTELKHMRADIDELKLEVEQQKLKPARRWEALVVQLMSLVTAALVGGALAKAVLW